MDNSKIKQIY